MKFFVKPDDSKWIGYDAANEFCNFQLSCLPAPYLRREFECASPAGAKIAICGLGYYQLYLNGKRAGDHVLSPLPGIYDKHVLYVVYDVEKLLKRGRNTVAVVLGTGWYNAWTPSPWVLEKAAWRDHPKMLLELRDGKGKLITGSDTEWKMTRNGPIRMDALRAGEHYDARMELDGWTRNGYDDSDWTACTVVRGPGGILAEQTGTPVRIVDTLPLSKPNRHKVYDAGKNIAGHARITVQGKAGAKVTIRYTERLTDDGELCQKPLVFDPEQDNCPDFPDPELWQTDVYTLKGSEKPEVWETEFSYHGFRYIGIVIEGDAELKKLEARVVNTDFKEVGNFTSGMEVINKLQAATRLAYLGNFAGIPTDCPHREKCGWTGDAQLACDTGLFNFDAAASYKQWLQAVRDCQRPSGELPGIVPTGGWGFNWGNGPAWDNVIFEIPMSIYRHTGDDSELRLCYEPMKRYVRFVESTSLDHIVQFGLGDWRSPDTCTMADPRLTNTAIYYGMLKILMEAAHILDCHEDYWKYFRLAQQVKKAFHRTFYAGKGIYGKGELTSIGCALYYELCSTPAVWRAARLALAKAAEKCGATAQFGIVGAKVVPRALAETGYRDLAAKFFTQTEYPGWANWIVNEHSSTLREDWSTKDSWNHIMFGDISAWCFRYIGGFRPGEDYSGGKKHMEILPYVIPSWKKFRAEYRGFVSEWEYCGNGVAKISITVPEMNIARVFLQDGRLKTCIAGKYDFIINIINIEE